ncbi:MAG: response regulator transcription factor [Alphaproteobacteria bacterium]|nr:response regulator transcription factor [Alphaproteobacteria bacterium]MDE2164202.1 response regulator transcription factor [Alphaproteobacteria bacterium]MDE2264295.1 response regulator transcription factor [Alphaproteobacteria bacterium]MDE2499144.1 response regulator transcription factor [Alphaproteobacteria bacterium]
MAENETVFIIDDDAGIRDSLSLLVESVGYRPKPYASGVAFLESEKPEAVGCMLVDVQMPDLNGLQLQQELSNRHFHLPVIIMTGHGDVPIAVQAMKAGAVDFLEKPFNDDVLLDCISRALARLASTDDAANAAREAEKRLTQLTERERQVLDLIVAGKANKVIAYELSISPRTVEIHRSRVMEKMDAGNLADLVRMVLSIKP